MSAIVTIPSPENGPCEHGTTTVSVPKANGYEVDSNGWLHLKTSAWAGDKIGLFRQWHHVVITPDRGPDGRFVKRGD